MKKALLDLVGITAVAVVLWLLDKGLGSIQPGNYGLAGAGLITFIILFCWYKLKDSVRPILIQTFIITLSIIMPQLGIMLGVLMIPFLVGVLVWHRKKDLLSTLVTALVGLTTAWMWGLPIVIGNGLPWL